MNILLGSHSTGKTTLLKEVNKTRSDIYTSDGYSRPIKSIATSAHLTEVQQQKIINELTLWRWNEDFSKKNCLYTRSLIDSIIYTEALYPEIKTESLRSVFEETYHPEKIKIFYIPIEFPLIRDGVRFQHEELQYRIDNEIKQFISTYNLDFILLSGLIQERTRALLENL